MHRVEVNLATGEKRIIDYTQEEEAAHAAAVAANAPIEARHEKNIAILALEASITERRKREAILTDTGKAWLAAKEAEIAALRATL